MNVILIRPRRFLARRALLKLESIGWDYLRGKYWMAKLLVRACGHKARISRWVLLRFALDCLLVRIEQTFACTIRLDPRLYHYHY